MGSLLKNESPLQGEELSPKKMLGSVRWPRQHRSWPFPPRLRFTDRLGGHRYRSWPITFWL